MSKNIFLFFQIQYGRKNIDGTDQMVNNKLTSLVSWRSNSPNQEDGHKAEVRSWKTLIGCEITA